MSYMCVSLSLILRVFLIIDHVLFWCSFRSFVVTENTLLAVEFGILDEVITV